MPFARDRPGSRYRAFCLAGRLCVVSAVVPAVEPAGSFENFRDVCHD